MLFANTRRQFALRRAATRFTLDALDVLPGDLRTAEPGFADELAAGSFGIAGGAVTLTGRSVFDLPTPSAAFARELHGFGWLRHLAGARTEAAEHAARDLVLAWIEGRARHPELADEPGVRARRLLSWLAHANAALATADAANYDRITAALGVELASAAADWRSWPAGPARLLALVALIEATLATHGDEATRTKLEGEFERECSTEILPDGGHVSRSPAVAVELMLDLVALRQHYAAADVRHPPFFAPMVARLGAFLTRLRHPDGAIARFNGMGATPRDEVAALLMPLAPAHGASIDRESGYGRLEAGSTVVFADLAAPRPGASALSFEMSAGGVPLIVNRGAGADGGGLAVADHSSLGIGHLAPDPRVRAGAGVPVLMSSADGHTIETAGIVHGAVGAAQSRSLSLARDGRRLDGRERLAPLGAAPVADQPTALRFHVHPSVQVDIDRNGAVRITPARGGAWRLTSPTGAFSVEASVFRALASGPKACHQAVLHGRTAAMTELTWSLVKE
jgi:uncharacterized heparinase superfamily protein